MNLDGANLSDTVLKGADLRDANLTNSVLSGANLEDALLMDATLTGATMTSDTRGHNANIFGAIFAPDYYQNPAWGPADIAMALGCISRDPVMATQILEIHAMLRRQQG